MQPLQHQMMGYDRAITMFSPDGRLLQVEYAKKTVKQGSTAIGVVCSDGVLFVTDKRIVDPLIVKEAIEKIWQIDDHMAVTAAGILSDARVLIDRAQIVAQRHKITYDTPVDIIAVVKDICYLKQICTQSAGLRPFGVSLLVAGVDENGPALFETDPTGIFFQYNASVIGEGETEIEEILHKEFRVSMAMKDAMKMCINAMSRVLDKSFNVDRVDAAYIGIKDKTFKKMSREEIEKVFREVRKK